jgi:hypothetical protein
MRKEVSTVKKSHPKKTTFKIDGVDLVCQETIKLTPEQQLAFWKELNKAPRLTPAQRRLGAIIRGEL